MKFYILIKIMVTSKNVGTNNLKQLYN